ncbi:MAG: hypothetical protein DELT_02909 [Desulfovibrio sp.]
MPDQCRLKQLCDFINIEKETPFSSALKVLRDSRVCRYLLHISGQDREFSLLTRKEARDAHEESDVHRPSLSRLKSALTANIPENHRTLLTDFSDLKERIVFPDDIEDATGRCGQELFMAALFQTVKWFRSFMAGCESGHMDIKTLNEFKYTKGFILEFQPSGNPMNPALSAAELYDTGDDVIERKLLCNFIYPFLFSNQGSELTKVRRCRNCGTYFIGKRVSATFCGTKCRNTYYYEHSK